LEPGAQHLAAIYRQHYRRERIMRSPPPMTLGNMRELGVRFPVERHQGAGHTSHLSGAQPQVGFRGTAEVRQQANSANSVENDP
jgi:hypothetical protein